MKAPCMWLAVSLAVGCGGEQAAEPAPAPVSGPDTTAMTCDQRTETAAQQTLDVVMANQSCETDEDCVLVDRSTECSGDCPNVVGLGGREAMQQAIAEINDSLCASFQADGCALATPSCLPEEAPACRDGRCL